MFPIGASGQAARDTVPAAPDSTLTVGEIRLESHNIFSESELAASSGLNRTVRRAMNALHVRTRPSIIKRELLLASGDPFDERKLRESERNLRALGILNRVEIAAEDTTADGRVNLAVHSFETWTFSAGLSLALASSGDLRWNLAVTEKNFLGYGTFLLAAVGEELDASYGRLFVRQNRLFGSPLTVELNVDERSDGFARWLTVFVPFRAEDQTWSVLAHAMDRRYRARWYLSNAGPAGSDPARWESLYALLPFSMRAGRLEAMRRVNRLGSRRIWRLGAGVQILEREHDLGDGLFRLADGRVADLSALDAPGQPLARDRGTEVWPHVILSSQGRRWVQTRFLFNYGNLEDVPLDLAWELRCGPAGPSMGSTAGAGERWRATAALSNWEQVGNSFWLQRVLGYASFGAAADRHHQIEALLGNYQRLGPGARPLTLKTFLEASHGEGLRGDQAPVLGLDRGLRTLDIDGMAGDRMLRWSTELGRTLPWVVLDIVQLGWGVFYGGGLARWQDEDRGLRDARHEIGAGLRFGSTRSGTSDLARFDVTYDLSGRSGLALTTIARGFF